MNASQAFGFVALLGWMLLGCGCANLQNSAVRWLAMGAWLLGHVVVLGYLASQVDVPSSRVRVYR